MYIKWSDLLKVLGFCTFHYLLWTDTIKPCAYSLTTVPIGLFDKKFKFWLNLSLLNILHGIINLPVLELSIINFKDINSIEPGQTTWMCRLAWSKTNHLQRIITSGSITGKGLWSLSWFSAFCKNAVIVLIVRPSINKPCPINI